MADYDLDPPLDPTSAADRVQMAADVLDLLGLLAGEPTVRAAVVDAIKTYERDVLKDVTWHP